MKSDDRFVFDTNVAISAALQKRSVSRRALNLALVTGTLLASVATLDELNEVIRRPGFDRYVSEAERLEFVAAYVREVELVEVSVEVNECRDPKDDKFLELAASGNATCIVTGDEDLLVPNPWRGVPIMRVREFLQAYEDLPEDGATRP